MTNEHEVELNTKTKGVSRRGPVVLRDASPHSQTVHALLRHLEAVGFSGSPRVVDSGFDSEGRETLSYIEGEIMHPGQDTLEAAISLGQLLRNLHNSTSSFRPPSDAVWRPWFGRTLGEAPRIVGHCDAAPWNVVVRDGLPVALIDWDLAGPVDPLVELAHSAWLNARLYGDEIADQYGLPPVRERVRQLRAITDGYGLSRDQRIGFVDRMIEFAIHSAAADADEYGVTQETVQSNALWGMAWRSRSAAWMLRNRRALEGALQ